jgi:hypothetical protein
MKGNKAMSFERKLQAKLQNTLNVIIRKEIKFQRLQRECAMRNWS